MAQTGSILIAGAGIGGLAAALALARIGVASTVLERAAELGELGAGIQLGPNAFAAIDRLGVGDEARRIAVHVDALKLMDAVGGGEIASVALDEGFRTRFAHPYAVVHRGEFHAALLRACRDTGLVALRVRAAIRSYSQSPTEVRVALGDGEEVVGRALVGADGLRSSVRAQLVGDGPPRISGHTTYRAVLPTEHMPDELRWNAMVVWVGPKCHLVFYPISDGRSFNLVVTRDNGADRELAGADVAHDAVREAFAHVHPKLRQVIDRASAWKAWVLCDRDPVESWCDGRVALLGDAAHPMLQYMAQGACMALEDAVTLADEVGRSPGDLAAAFERYRVARVPRTARVQVSARRMGEDVFHLGGEAAARRNETLRALSRDDYLEMAAWLYGGPNEPAVPPRRVA